eukprot:228781-Pleurochrysis_carterae.AAC.1
MVRSRLASVANAAESLTSRLLSRCHALFATAGAEGSSCRWSPVPTAFKRDFRLTCDSWMSAQELLVLPVEVFSMTHLTLLNVSGNSLKELPSEVSASAPLLFGQSAACYGGMGMSLPF